MASFLTSSYFVILYFFTFYFKSLTAYSNSSFNFNNYGRISNFDSVFVLYGDAKVVNDGLSLRLTAPLVSSAGRVIYKTPKKLVSFSTYFSFSISSDSRNSGGLAFALFPEGYPVHLFDEIGDNFKFLSVEFDTNLNHVAINLSSFISSKITNLSSVNLRLNSGNRLQVWIDYDSNSMKLEVRMSRFGKNRPLDPLLFERIDLPKIWPEEQRFFVGISSSNGNSSHLCNLYSWSFKTRQASNWMHSEPLDPIVLKEREETENKIPKKSDCVMRILSALILGVGLGALGSFIGVFLWTIFAKKRPIVPEEYATKR